MSKVGIEVSTVYDFLRMKLPEAALVSLLKLMKVVRHPAIKQGIVRALSDQSYSEAVGPELVEYFQNIDPTEWSIDSTKWVISNNIEIVSNISLLGRYVENSV
jgi:hypothetical protein